MRQHGVTITCTWGSVHDTVSVVRLAHQCFFYCFFTRVEFFRTHFFCCSIDLNSDVFPSGKRTVPSFISPGSFESAFLIFARGISIVKKSTDIFGMFVALGITLNLILYFIIHVGYNVGLLPTTGLPLPFVSYGGSHTIFNLFQIGLLLSISYRMKNGKS